MFCYLHRGKSTKKRQQQHYENKIVEIRTTTMERSLGNASIRPHEMKFRSWEQNKDPKSIGKRRHKLTTSDARRCYNQITMDYTQMMASNGADTLGSHTKDHGVTLRYLRHV
jgi:hypothetical protein